MARVTIKAIIDAIVKKYGVKREYIGLDKDGDIYYWHGEFSLLLRDSENCTHLTRLSDWSVERWVDEFDGRVETQLKAIHGAITPDELKNINRTIEAAFSISTLTEEQEPNSVKLPPVKADLKDFEKLSQPSVDVLLRIVGSDSHAIGRYIHGVGEWQVYGWSGKPKVEEWWELPAFGSGNQVSLESAETS